MSRTKAIIAAAIVVVAAALLASTTCPSRAPETSPVESPSPAAPRAVESRDVTPPAAAPRSVRPTSAAPSRRDETKTPADADEATRDTVVRIVVRNAVGGAPVVGAAVAARIESNAKDVPIRYADAVSGGDGVAAIDLLGCQADITVRKVGFVVKRAYVPAEAAEYFVQLTAGVPVRGRVVYAGSRAPAADVAVRGWTYVGDKQTEVDVEQRTGADGRFELAGMPDGANVSIYAVQRGFRTADWVGEIKEARDVELVLGDGGVLEGVVSDENGRPMPGVDVFLLQPERLIPSGNVGGAHGKDTTADLLVFVFRPSVTDASGRYRFAGVRLSTDEKPQLRCAVARAADGREIRSEPVVFVRAGERQTRDLRFGALGSLRVVVSAPASLSEGLAVTVEHGKNTTVGHLDDARTALFKDVAAGAYSVSVQRAGRATRAWKLTKAAVEVKPGEMTVAEFDLAGVTALTGRVVDDTGAPVRRLSVQFASASAAGSQEAGGGTDEFGRFRIDALLPTPGHVMVEQTGSDSGDARLAGASWLDATPGGAPVTIVMRRVTTLKGRVSPVPRDRKITFDVRADDGTTGTTEDVAEDGLFEYVIPASGERVFVSIRTDDFVPTVVVDGSAPPGAMVDLGTVKLDAGVALDLVLRDADGHALAGARVDCLDFFFRGRSATADADGRVRFERVPRHALRLLVHETPTTPMARPVISDPSAPPAVLTIAAGALVTGRVVDAAGRPPAEHLLISFRPKSAAADPDGKTTWVWTEEGGAYRARLEPALYRVLVRDKNQGPALTDSVDLAVADGETRTLDLRLR